MKKNLLLLSMIMLLLPFQLIAQHDYVNALEKSIWFYDGNKCGPDAGLNNVFSWRGACHIDDGIIDNIDLSGGYHTGGDHIKFGSPQAWSAAVLGWTLYEYRDIFNETGMTSELLPRLKYFTDYFLKSHTDTDTFYYHVGESGNSWWGSPELETGDRPLIKATPSDSASDVTAGTAAALALIYLNYMDTDLVYAEECLLAAIELYAIALSDTGRSSDGTTQGYYYGCTSHYDDMAWAAIWLAIATGDNTYLNPVENWLDTKQNDYGDDNYNIDYAPYWGEVTLFVLLKMAELTGEEKYKNGVINNLTWARDELERTTNGSLPFFSNYDPLRLASAEAGLGYMAYKLINWDGYNSTGDLTINYILGDNPRNKPYLTNWNGGPEHPYHMANEPVKYGPVNGLLGGLTGGPEIDDHINDDDVSEYVSNRVSIDNNAAFILGLAGFLKSNNLIITDIPLTVTITMPDPAKTYRVNDDTGIVLLVSDIDNEIVKTEFYINNTLYAATENPPLLAITWSPSEAITYEISAKVYDDQGNVAAAEPVIIQVLPQTPAPPSINISSPFNGSTFNQGDDIIIDSTVRAGTGDIDRVEYYINDEIIITFSESPYTYTLENIQAGIYEIKAIIYDTTTMSDEGIVTITVIDPVINDFNIEYTEISDWGTGFQGEITITNNCGEDIAGWELEFAFSGNQSIQNGWNGIWTQSGQNVIVTNTSWNGYLQDGQSLTIGFTANYSGTNEYPEEFQVTPLLAD